MRPMWIPVVLAAVLILSSCARIGNPPAQPAQTMPSGEDDYAAAQEAPVDFQLLEFSKSAVTAVTDIYRVEKEEGGVCISHLLRRMDAAEGETRETLIYACHYGEDVLAALQQRCGDAKITSWNGFHGTDSRVLDGYGMSFTAVLADGTKVAAEDNNMAPDSYRELKLYVSGLVDETLLETASFENDVCRISLPESWVDKVYVSHDYQYNVFMVKTDQKPEGLRLFRLDQNLYAPTENDRTFYIAKVVSPEGDTWHISLYSYLPYMAPDDGPEELQAICASFQDDLSAIAESICGVNGYELTEKDDF
ncbi:MAG: hypothetical protein HUJ80_09345 [Firmicutes bacterium]|nr:hypothetical protein [Bacillota bacterium]